MNTYIVVYFDNYDKNMHNFQTEAKNKAEAILNFYNECIAFAVPTNVIDLGDAK